MAKRKAMLVGADGSSLTPDFLKGVGGKQLSMGRNGGNVWNFGWIPPLVRSTKQEKAHEDAMNAMPRFGISGQPKREVYDQDKVALCMLWKHPDVVAANGSEFTGIHQLTGSCVGCGGGNAMTTLACCDVILRGDNELPKVAFWPIAYGRSRFYLGDRNPGEGSTGSTFARAAREDGKLPFDTAGLPQPTRTDGWVWGSSVEMAWSDGDANQTMTRLPESRKFLIQTTAQCKDSTDVFEAIYNGYPCTAASMYAHDGGRVQGSGDGACLLARRSGSWSHQMSIQAAWKHPQFGNIFWLHNQWGLNAHGRCPTGMPPGGVWITAADVDWICRDEVFAFSGDNGYPAAAKPIPWIF